MAHSEVYGICESKCKVPVFSKDNAYGVDRVENVPGDGSEAIHTYAHPNEKWIYRQTPSVKVYLMGELEELVKINPNFNTTIVLQNTYRFNTLLANILKVTYADDINYPVKFFAPSDLNPMFCTVLHFNLFYDGFNICCNVNGY